MGALLPMAAATLLVHLGTNVDNLIALALMAGAVGPARAALAFVLVQLGVIGGAWALSFAAEAAAAGWLGLVGLVPLALGIQQLLGRGEGEGRRAPASLAAGIAFFAGLSTDTFAAFLALLGDTARGLDPGVLLGAGLSIVIITGLGLGAHRVVGRMAGTLGRLERATPFILIASGLYVLANTATDLAPGSWF